MFDDQKHIYQFEKKPIDYTIFTGNIIQQEISARGQWRSFFAEIVLRKTEVILNGKTKRILVIWNRYVEFA